MAKPRTRKPRVHNGTRGLENDQLGGEIGSQIKRGKPSKQALQRARQYHATDWLIRRNLGRRG